MALHSPQTAVDIFRLEHCATFSIQKETTKYIGSLQVQFPASIAGMSISLLSF